jgi:hypothetical protein
MAGNLLRFLFLDRSSAGRAISRIVPPPRSRGTYIVNYDVRPLARAAVRIPGSAGVRIMAELAAVAQAQVIVRNWMHLVAARALGGELLGDGVEAAVAVRDPKLGIRRDRVDVRAGSHFLGFLLIVRLNFDAVGSG